MCLFAPGVHEYREIAASVEIAQHIPRVRSVKRSRLWTILAMRG
jgi:hypothetical protein